MSRAIQVLFAGAAMSAALPAAAWCQSASPVGLEEVVVTATRTGESKAQTTPLSVTVLSGDSLAAAGAVNANDLARLTPSLTIGQNVANPTIYIRGVGTNNITNGSDPDVTTQVDGVYIARPYAQLTDFLDVQRVEVLRGPQGTLYGRNAVGGTINVISRTPSDIFTADASVALGNFSRVQTQGYVSGPLIANTLSASLAVTYLRHDDYVKNIVPGGVGANGANRGGLRAQLLYKPNDRFQATTRADFFRADEHADSYDHTLVPYPFTPLANSIIGDYSKVAINAPQQTYLDVSGISEELNYKLTDHFSIKSLTAYRESRFRLTNDNDGTELPSGNGYQADRDNYWTQEFNVNYRSDRLNAVGGLYYLSETNVSTNLSAVMPSIALPAANSFLVQVKPAGTIQSKAGFIQGTYALTETLHLTAGVRYTQDNKAATQNFSRTSLNPATLGINLPGSPFVGSANNVFSATTPKGSIDWQVLPSVMVYGEITKGWKSGGTNGTASNLAALVFRPETLISYEGGVKSEWLDKRLRLNVTGFKYDYTDLQVQSLLSPGVVSITNAATAQIKGLEIETLAKPVPQLKLGLNYSLLDAVYGAFPAASVPAVYGPYLIGNPKYNAAAGSFNAAGDRLNNSPASSYSLSADYSKPVYRGKFFVRADYFWQDKTYFDPSNAYYSMQKAYSLTGASIGYTDEAGHWTAQIMGKNLANTQYLTTIIAVSLVPAGVAGPPRTVAFQLSKSW